MTNIERAREPYIGVSGVVSPEIQHALTDMSEQIGLFDKRRLALGVKAVHKTQFLDIPNKYGPDWYPVGEQSFSSALDTSTREDPRILAVAQTYLDVDYVENPAYRTQFTDLIVKRGEPWLRAIQFDMLPWHSDKSIRTFLEWLRREHNVNIMLQAHQDAMSTLGPDQTADMLGELAEHLDYVLFDASHGKGLPLDTDKLSGFLDAASSHSSLENVGLAVAGGLNAELVREKLPELIAQYPDLSWDAEGQLHPAHTDETRPLDLAITRSYLDASTEILKRSLQ